MSAYIVRCRDVFATVEPTLHRPDVEAGRAFCVTFAWTLSKGEAVRFTSKWHAKAVARALTRDGHRSCVVRVAS